MFFRHDAKNDGKNYYISIGNHVRNQGVCSIEYFRYLRFLLLPRESHLDIKDRILCVFIEREYS